MAEREHIAKHYNVLGPLHLLRLLFEQYGFPDYTNAYWNGDFNQSLHQAQLSKHVWIFEQLGLPEDLTDIKVLDIGCGWGPILNAVRKRGGEAVGLTLSDHQLNHCRKAGLEVYLRDYKTLSPCELGEFDAVISIGALEHFCSVKENTDGLQAQIYRDFFKICAQHLKPGGGLFLQTMTWNDNPPNYDDLSLDAPKHSKEAILARMEHFYPGSWLPNGLSQLQETAKPYFDFVSSNDGRMDYIETLKRWGASTKNLYPWNNPELFFRALIPFTKLIYGLATSSSARIQWESLKMGDQSACFKRSIMGHQRMFFRKK